MDDPSRRPEIRTIPQALAIRGNTADDNRTGFAAGTQGGSVKDICGYILDTFGKFPATVDPIQLTLMIQAHHLDLDFYDAHMKPGAYLETHRDHFRDWHGGVEPRKRN